VLAARAPNGGGPHSWRVASHEAGGDGTPLNPTSQKRDVGHPLFRRVASPWQILCGGYLLRGVDDEVVLVGEGDGDVHAAAQIPDSLGNGIVEDHEALDGLTGGNGGSAEYGIQV
jgi:hypothetical protein